jgi:hypothetical protein
MNATPQVLVTLSAESSSNFGIKPAKGTCRCAGSSPVWYATPWKQDSGVRMRDKPFGRGDESSSDVRATGTPPVTVSELSTAELGRGVSRRLLPE